MLLDKTILRHTKVSSPGAQRKKVEVPSPLIVEFGNPVDQNIYPVYYRFWPGDISRKAQET